MVEAAGEDERELAAEMAAAFLNENLPEAIFGAPKAGSGQWASLVRLVNPIQGNNLDLVQLEQNEAAFRWAGEDTAVMGQILIVNKNHVISQEILYCKLPPLLLCKTL